MPAAFGPVALGDSWMLGVLTANAAGVVGTLTLDGTTVKQAMMFVPSAGVTVDKVGFYIVGVTSAQNLTVSLYALDTTNGDPTTLVGNVATVAAASVTATTWIETSGHAAALTAGQPYAVVFDWPGTAGNITLRILSAGAVTRPFARHTYTQPNAGTWGTKTTTAIPCFYLETAAGVSIPVMGVLAGHTLTPFSLATGGTIEAALRFTSPVLGDLCGAFCYYSLQANHALALRLFTDAGALLSDGYATDEDQTAENGNGPGYLALSTTTRIYPGVTYKLAIKQSAGGAACAVQTLQYNAAKHRDAEFTGGQTFHFQEYSAGAWQTADTARWPFIVPMLSAIYPIGPLIGGGKLVG